MKLAISWSRVAIAMAASFLIVSNASANLVINPGFEDPAFAGAEAGGAGDGWTVFAEPNQFRIQGQPPIGPAGAFDGTVVLKVFGTSGVSQDFSVGPNGVVTGLAWALNDSADAMAPGQVAAVNLVWLSGGVPIPNVVSFGSTINGDSPQDVWTQIGVVGAAVPDGSDGVRIELITGPFAGAGGGAPRFDGASLEIVPIPAAVWLFGSALGLLAGVRRRFQA